ncbi:hypothetical protein AAVH_09626 [Aphelenchoides avenae]|nr:hypothetical protein AAVH_09626 [Aphelenchus avenae]
MISDLRECRLEESEVLKDQIRSEAARCVRLESEKRDLQDRIDAMVKENHERTITMMAETFAWKSKYSTAEGESGLLRDRIKDLTERIKELQAEKSSPAVPAKAAVRKNAGHTKPPPAGKPKKKHESDAEIETILGARTENVKNAVKSADVAEEAAHSTTETTRETTYGDSGHASTSGSPDEYDPLFPEMDRSEGGLSGNSLD